MNLEEAGALLIHGAPARKHIGIADTVVTSHFEHQLGHGYQMNELEHWIS